MTLTIETVAAETGIPTSHLHALSMVALKIIKIKCDHDEDVRRRCIEDPDFAGRYAAEIERQSLKEQMRAANWQAKGRQL